MKRIGILFCIIILSRQVAIAQIKSTIHRENIKTVFVGNVNPQQYIQSQPVIELRQQDAWFLSFDDLSLKTNTYYLRIISCQSDWTPSSLSEIEYLQDFNDIPLRDARSSMGTKISYLNYHIALPKVRISGNYIAQVYANRNKRDTVFTQRFSIVENEIQVAASVQFGQTNASRATSQVLQLTLRYSDGLMIQSEDDLRVFVRKNNEPDFILKNLPKPVINGMDRSIRFPSFNQENSVLAGNEYRLIDLRSVQQKLNFVSGIEEKETQTRVITQIETAQGYYPYTERKDLNGQYIISNYENLSDTRFADYVICQFNLKATNQAPEDVYVTGGFNNYQKTATNRMKYIPSLGIYQADMMLKQGIYNYRFETKNPSDYLEGNYAQTENQYDILVYFRKPGTRIDSLIGFQRINSIH
jgi:hypothetical protein